ncbi:hypothetical protein V3C99_011443, partial [Haemonchus contortus]
FRVPSVLINSEMKFLRHPLISPIAAFLIITQVRVY